MKVLSGKSTVTLFPWLYFLQSILASGDFVSFRFAPLIEAIVFIDAIIGVRGEVPDLFYQEAEHYVKTGLVCDCFWKQKRDN